jgi:hypothetical protein
MAGSHHHYPFCPERILQVTPFLRIEVATEGRIQRGETLLFPNVSPGDRHSVVVVLTGGHFVKTGQFSATELRDGLPLSINYFQRRPRPGWGEPRSGHLELHATSRSQPG